MNLPQGWIEIKFESIIEKISILNELKIKQKNYLNEGLFPIIDQGEVFIGGYTNDIQKVINCRIPAIIFGDHTRCVKFLPFKFCAGADGIKAFNHIGCFDAKLLFYFVKVLVKKIPDKGYARHYQYLEKEFIPLPPLAEQQRIVAKIDSLFSELDNGVTLLKTIKAQLAVYRQAVLKWAFEGKLTEEWRKLNGIAVWKQTTIESFLVKTDKPMSTGPFGTMLKKHEHQKSGVPVLGIENIGNGIFVHGNKIFVTPDKAEYLKSFALHTNDVIISRSGTVGELCLVPQELDGSLMSTNLIRVTLDENVIIPKFFVFLFQSKGIVIDQVKELCKGSTRAFLNQTILKKISFPLLSIDEQQQIINAIESRLSVCEKLEQAIDQTLALSDSLRQSILKKAFKGRLVPQDPNDEPAEKLLERIRAEKAAVATGQKQTRKRCGK
ncbi:MAG: restriction endonuclease subunit S [Treponema sp.]|jgi:type I restriction enzyme S subunit|nr:restriction endonuclease subunit S [Treponema sp.]